jgi:anti-sigma-K factor RskA
MTSDLHHLAAAYALDALVDDERAAFEAHLSTCDTCRHDVAEFGATAARMADGVATSPPSHLRDRVLGAVATTRQDPPAVPAPDPSAAVSSLAEHRRRRFSMATLLATAAAVALFAVGAVVIMAQRGGGPDVGDVIAAPDAVVSTLEGSPGSVRLVWSPERDQVALIADGIAAPGPGFVYELWAIAAGTPIPSGLFVPDDGTIREVIDIADVDPAAWGVTIEPAGGSPAPTGEILYYGELET